ncbi:hypothetical protein A4S06_01730 [Erysipelotrichaceae bacterium MTC7]|nr:hypothetical protein A4S06_01730 [Erysipelotrichaceae bacterium MTC7]
MPKITNRSNETARFNRTQKILIFICLILITFGFITRIVGGNAASKSGYDLFTMLRYSLIDQPTRTVVNFSEDISNLWSVQSENDELRQEIASQKLYKTELEDTKRRLAELEELQKISSNDQYDSIGATVIARDTQGWSNIMTINVGSNSGIEKDMSVINSKGLIGRVLEVHANTSKVQLLTAEKTDSQVSIKIELSKEKATTGSLEKFDKTTGTFTANIFDSTVEIKKGMSVVTSGIGGLTPSGILVGEVKEVEKLYNAEGVEVRIKPAADFNDFTYVSVLKVK